MRRRIRGQLASAEPGFGSSREDQVTLRGDKSSDPSGGRLTYHWSQLPSNPFPVSFSHNDSEDAFAVRVTLTDEGKYHFVLEVENEAGLWSVPDTVEVGVRPPTGTGRSFSLLGGGEMAFVWIEPGVFQMGAPESEINESDCIFCDVDDEGRCMRWRLVGVLVG